MFQEDELLALSGLQHLVFCERQFSLIHVEQVWVDNVLTVEGQHLHEQVDQATHETRKETRIVRGLPVRSLRLGLAGRADVVELVGDPEGVAIGDLPGRWRPFPVEYKRGRPKLNRADEVQVCAQGICLEEMLGATIPGGALFYGQVRRRTEVAFDSQLRAIVEAAARRAHELVSLQLTPRTGREPKCDQCSLVDICRPDAGSRSATQYLDEALGMGRGGKGR